MSVLTVSNLNKHYRVNRKTSICAVNGVDLHIKEGETLGLVGESGCGKTTVGKCVAGLIPFDRGEIDLLGLKLAEASLRVIRLLRNQVQVVFQDPYGSLNPRKVVKQIIQDPLDTRSFGPEGMRSAFGRQEKVVKVRKAMNLVGLDQDHLHKYPVQLTQGEQQRVGIARAFVTAPRLVILDEPTSSLDIRFRGEIIKLLKKIQTENEVAYLFISHDLVVISQLSDRIAVMYLGRIVEEGPTREVFGSPVHPYTRALFGAVLKPDPDQERADFKLKGEVPSPVNLPDDQCNLFTRCPVAEDSCRWELPRLQEVGKNHLVACPVCAKKGIG